MVNILLGKREITSIGIEGSATYGTAVNPTIIFKNSRITPRDNEDWQETHGIGSDEIYVEKEVGNKIRGFDWTFNPQDWRFLTFVFGQSTQGGVAGAYTHTWTGKAKTVRSFTLERNMNTATSVRTYDGCKINRLTIGWNIGGGGATGKYITCDANCIAQDITLGTSAAGTPAAPTTALFQAKHVLLTLANSTDIGKYLISGNITIDLNQHPSMYAYYDADGTIQEPTPQLRRISGTFVLHSVDHTPINYQYLRTVIDSGSDRNYLDFKRGTNDQLRFQLVNLRFRAPDTTALEGANTINVDWDCDYVVPVATDAIENYLDEV